MTPPPPRLTKKLCLLGGTAVGKTSLVQRYVRDSFDESYRETLGVAIHSMDVAAGDSPVRLLLWDLEGLSAPMAQYREDFLLGAHGYVLVVDATRAETLDIAHSLHDIATGMLGTVPFVTLFNKADLKSRWDLQPGDIEKMAAISSHLYETSAKTGQNVREAFERLTALMLEADGAPTRSDADEG